MPAQGDTGIHYESLEDWVDAFCAFDVEPPRKRTFTEIMGIEKKEVYASKLLAFFFTSDEYHGMGDLWMRSLLELISAQKDAQNIGDVSVVAEVSTDEKKRIDLTLFADSCAVAIEHKIDAALYNDLNAYAKKAQVEAEGRSIQTVHHVVLAKDGDESLLTAWEKERGNLNDKWVVVTHKELFDRVKLNIGDYLGSADLKCIALMNDFMDGICPPHEEISQALLDCMREGKEEWMNKLAKGPVDDELFEKYVDQRGRIKAKLTQACADLVKYMGEDLKQLSDPSKRESELESGSGVPHEDSNDNNSVFKMKPFYGKKRSRSIARFVSRLGERRVCPLKAMEIRAKACTTSKRPSMVAIGM